MLIICNSCKTENRPKAKYCKFCGKGLGKKISSGLENIIGRDEIKDKLNRFIKSLSQYKKGWASDTEFNKNMVITGSTGTGKTLLVYSIAKLFCSENIISKKNPILIDASEFNTFLENLDNKFSNAEGGILFIDNFHKLISNNQNNNGIDKFFHKMSMYRNNPIVILSGNPSEIERYFVKNPDIKNRFEHFFKLHDFSSSELYQICKNKIEKTGLKLNEDSANKLSWLFKYKVKTKDSSFGNAHLALNIAEDIILGYYHRVSFGTDDNSIIKLADIGEDVPKQKTLNEIFSELDSFIGLEKVKAALRDIAQQIKNEQRLNDNRKDKYIHFGFHMVLTGNPGTGKTMIVRKLGEILSAINYLDRGHVVEVDKSKLVGQYIGETPQIVQKKCDEAMGGILFIDEAYALAPTSENANKYGQEAIDTLLKRMEDDRDKFVVIAAGYQNEMQHFINSNPGLKSRFDRFIHLDDYTPTELTEIFKYFVSKSNYSLSAEAEDKLPEIINELYERREKIFGNGREIRKLFENTVINLSKRIGELNFDQQTYSKMTLIEPSDFPFKIEKKDSLENIFAELNELIGLKNIKTEFEKLAAFIKVEQKRKEFGGERILLNNHFVFMGNPGTGKTTVARLLGKIFKALGVLPKGHVIEVDRSNLVAKFIGQTSTKTNEVIDTAMGGILFIDEAYSLVVEDSKSDFGQQAIQTLLKRMEDDAEKFVVIVAGYPNEMDEFINSNPGLSSRFKRQILFDDFTAEELFDIFILMLKNKNLALTNKAVKKAKKIFAEMYSVRNKNFGNGRTVRNVFESALENQSFRVAKLLNSPQLNKDLLHTIEAEDIQT
jgi:SpoVK/Ycf46/Vps4 family AAA+-type ATPase